MAKGGSREFCTVDGCGRQRVGRGLCGLHYSRLTRSGSVDTSVRSHARAEKTAPDGTRQCFKCGNRKSYILANFPPDRRGKGLKGTCRDCLKRSVKNSVTIARYGIGLDAAEKMLSAQGGKCAVCHIPLNGSTKTELPHIDHCHESGMVRGILCHHCNVLLGHAKDSVELLRNAIAYLEKADANP